MKRSRVTSFPSNPVVQVQCASMNSMNDLPPEMLMEILKCVDTRTLFACRLVNKTWSGISSRILRHRSDAQIGFELADVLYSNRLWRRNGNRFKRGNRTLKDFLRCMKKSQNVPVAHFAFPFTVSHLAPLGLFDYKHFMEFLSDFSSSDHNQNQNQRIIGLDLSGLWLRDVDFFLSKLRHLLLYKIPRLEEFSLKFTMTGSYQEPQGQSSHRNDSFLEPQFQLPHLKVLRFKSDVIFSYPQIATDLLNAAVNLKGLEMEGVKLADFYWLQSLGKLDVLKKARIEVDGHFCLHLLQQQLEEQQQQQQQFSTTCFPQLQLNTLDFVIKDGGVFPICFNSTANFLNNIFESSKNTLTRLRVELSSCGFGHLIGLDFPTFTNLRELSLCQFYNKEWIFPRGIRHMNVFPAVNSLDLSNGFWNGRFPQQDSIPIFPSVKTFAISDKNCSVDVVPVVALMFPNLKTFQIHRATISIGDGDVWIPQLNFARVGPAIWTHMTKLESLEVDVDVETLEHNPLDLDSCFTGISTENCQRLYELMVMKKAWEVCGFGFPGWTREKESQLLMLATQRENPSILDMKYLQKLTINVLPNMWQTSVKSFLTNSLTWISHECAFKLMPNLKITEQDRRF